MIHPTIGIVELLIILLCTFSLGVEWMNWREGIADAKRVMDRSTDETEKQVVSMDTRSNSVFVLFSVVLVIAGIRGLFEPETTMTAGRTVVFVLFIAAVGYKMWVSMRNRQARWTVLRPTVVEEQDGTGKFLGGLRT